MRNLSTIVLLSKLVFQAVKSFAIFCVNCFPIEPLRRGKVFLRHEIIC